MKSVEYSLKRKEISIDIELTNACNASCTFCPRDSMPGIGTIKPENFYKAVERGLEHPSIPVFSFCGTGDSLLNKNIVEYAQHIREVGCRLQLSTNGHLMTEQKAKDLIDAGISRVTFSISSRGKRYEKEYGLDYETTHENILRFIALAKGKCDVRIAIVEYDENTPYEEDEAYWRSIGVTKIKKYNMVNRAGALFSLKELSTGAVRDARLEMGEKGMFGTCFAPFFLLFVGWDGHYYLCSSDWRKQVPVGHVSSHSIEETMAARRSAVQSRSPICSQCSADPVNKYLEDLSAESESNRLPVQQIV